MWTAQTSQEAAANVTPDFQSHQPPSKINILQGNFHVISMLNFCFVSPAQQPPLRAKGKTTVLDSTLLLTFPNKTAFEKETEFC